MQYPPNNPNQNGKKKPPQNPNEGGEPPRTPPQDWRRWAWPAVLVLLFILALTNLPDLGSLGSSASAVSISYSSLYDQIDRGNVAELTVTEQTVTGILAAPVTLVDTKNVSREILAGGKFTAMLPSGDNNDFLSAAYKRGVKVLIQPIEINPILYFITYFGPLLLIVGFFVWSARRAQRQMNGAFGFGRTQAREYTVERPQVKFTDVAGQESAKAELVEVVDFLKEPEKYIALGAKIPRGVLLVGPPGTGKTLMARAVAGEANVSFFSIAASEFVEMFVGVGASRVRDLFRRAKENAPSIVFVDEIDAVGRQRGAGLGGGHDEREQTLNQMLAEMDGFDRTESVIVMAATNRPDVLDPALLRPGRFDRQVTVGLPDKNGREAILKIHTRDKPMDKDVQLADMAKSTIGFSGADLANLANEAALHAARRNAKKLSMRDFLNAFDRIVLGNERPPLSDEKERKVVAYHEAGHALASALTPGADPVLKVTIVPRGQAGGVTVFMPDKENHLYSEGYLRARMIVGMGGRAAELVAFDEVTSGAVSDLRTVTEIARRMVTQFGMSDVIGPLNFGDEDRQPFLGYSIGQNRSYSEETAAKIDAEVRKLVDDAYVKTVKLLSNNRDKLDALAEALLAQEIIGYEEMFRVIGMSDKIPEKIANVFSNGAPEAVKPSPVSTVTFDPFEPDADGDPAPSNGAAE